MGYGFGDWSLIARLLGPSYPNLILVNSIGYRRLWSIYNISIPSTPAFVTNGVGPGNFPHGFAVEPDH